MSSRTWLKSPAFFVSLSFSVGVLNFLDTLARLTSSGSYPLGVYLKPVFFVAQTLSLIMFIISVRSSQNPLLSSSSLSRFFAVHLVLAVAVLLIYLDFQLSALAQISTTNVFLELALYLTYFAALVGTSFWFARELSNKNKRKWMFIFVLTGLAFFTVFLDRMFFWSQNYSSVALSSQFALFVTYAPHVLMFFAAMYTIVVLFGQASMKNASRLSLLLFVPAFLLPILWDSYKDGLINFVIRDTVYWGFGYSGYQWYSVSFYFMSIVAYGLTWRELSKRSDHTQAFSLILLGLASFPWNGVTALKAGYSSIPGNVISLSSIITRASLLMSRRGVG